MRFTSAINSELNNRKSITENGAIGYKTSGDQMVDFNFAVGSMRKWDERKIYNEFVKFFSVDKVTAMKYLFYLRDREKGIGERRTFRAILMGLANDFPTELNKVIKYIPVFGRWDDMWCLLDTSLKESVFEIVAYQLAEDKKNMDAGKGISLLAKWMPSINTSSDETKRLARKFKNVYEFTDKEYRKMLSTFRDYMNVLEVKMSAREWSEVNYNTIPSKANTIYKDAFMKHDENRRKAYLNALVRNDGSAKINAGVLFPHDVVNKYSQHYRWNGRVASYDETLEQLWKNLPNFVDGESNTLVIRDGSGSMTSGIDKNSNVTALDVATALTIYFSERLNGEFKDKFITFSAAPKWIDLSTCDSLHDKLVKCYKEDDCSNTNIEATFDLILRAAVSNNLAQEDLPKNLLIVSDMEFDGATTLSARYNYSSGRYTYTYDDGGFEPLFERIDKKFRDAGYIMPKLIFWNVNSRTNTIPIQKNNAGVILVSGFSAAISKMVCSEEVDPLKALLREINSERYACIEKAMA